MGIISLESTYQDTIRIKTDNDIVIAISLVRSLMKQYSWSEIDQQKVVVSVAELTRNVLDYAKTEGIVHIKINNSYLKLSVKDKGQGIKDLDDVLIGKKTKISKGLGIGLSAVKRLMDDMKIYTSERGTKIVVTKKRL